MGVEAGDDAIVHDQNALALADAADALGNDNLGHRGQLLAKSALYAGIGLRVAGRRGVVEHQDEGTFQQGAGNAQSLLLATADVGAALLYAGVIALGHLADELVGLSHPAGMSALFKHSVVLAPAQVVEHCAAEQRVLLQHHADSLAQHLQVVVLDIVPPDQHLAFCSVVES